MSFAQVLKSELMSLKVSKMEQKSELSALLKLNGLLHYRNNKLSLDFVTENASIARHVFTLIKDVYDSTSKITIQKSSFKVKKSYILQIEKDVDDILEDLELYGYDDCSIYQLRNLKTDAQKKSYLRGMFLASGSVNNPQVAKYHFEIKDKNYAHSLQILELLNYFSFNAKLIERKSHYVVYVKSAEKIVELFAYMGAVKGLLFFEQLRLTRDIKNNTNRITNCEQANYEKSFTAGKKQVDMIEKIDQYVGLDTLDEKLQIVCEFRLEYPEYSLQELADVMADELGIEISKSGLNHRFRKLKQIFENIIESNHDK